MEIIYIIFYLAIKPHESYTIG